MAEIIHRVGIAGSVNEVYNALTTDEGLSRWWTTDTSGAGNVGSIIKFRFDGVGPDFQVVEQQTNSIVRWKHSGDMPGPWVGTEISFHLTNGGGQTYVRFAHSKWQEPSDFMVQCSVIWPIVISLAIVRRAFRIVISGKRTKGVFFLFL